MEYVFSGPFDILIQAGQSNAEGEGLGPRSNPYEKDDRILHMNGGVYEDADRYTLSVAAESGKKAEFPLFFAREYVRDGRLAEGRRVLILRTALGGTGFLSGYLDRTWDMQGKLYLNMMQMLRHAKALHPENRVVALLWHQGETDALSKATFEGHRASLSGLIDAVRAETRLDLPVVMADFVRHWEDSCPKMCEPVVRAMRVVCAEKNGVFLETEGLTSNDQAVGNGDPIHFSAESLCQLGIAYYRAIFTH